MLGWFDKSCHVADELALQDGRLQRCAESSQHQPCRAARQAVAVVSNNSARTVHAYLTRHGLDDRITLVIARTNHNPALLRPSPT